MDLNIFFNCCIKEINKVTKEVHIKYKNKIKYTNEYYLNMIFYMLNDVNNWKFLSELKMYKSENKYHYKTIYNKFRLWVSLNVFENAFKNYKTDTHTNLLLIDATSINNKYGSENITLNVEYKKKKVTKLSLITDNNGFIYSITPFDIKSKGKSYYTSVHDVKMIDKSIDTITNINNESKYYHLLADKAYKTKNKYKYQNKNIKIITPDKKNAKKNKNTKFKNKKMKSRHKIEHVNCNIKKHERLIMRKDRKLKYFMGFVYMGCLLNNINCK